MAVPFPSFGIPFRVALEVDQSHRGKGKISKDRDDVSGLGEFSSERFDLELAHRQGVAFGVHFESRDGFEPHVDLSVLGPRVIGPVGQRPPKRLLARVGPVPSLDALQECIGSQGADRIEGARYDPGVCGDGFA